MFSSELRPRLSSAARQSGALRLSNFAAFLILFSVSPALLHAQFKEPTQEELKMTVDPKAPGAAAVYLYREEIVDNAEHFHSFYERVKVLTEKGKELATVRIPYEHGFDKIVKIQGRTIHADGSVVPLTVKPSDLMEFKTKGFQKNVVVFNLPSVEIGSILEYRYSYSGDILTPTWWIQQAYYVHNAHYSFFHNDYGNLLYSANLGDNAKIINKWNEFDLDISDVQPLPDEEWMPPLNAIRWRLEFYYTRFKFAETFWDYAGMIRASEVHEFTSPGKELRKAVGGIVAAGDTDQQKAVKIYAAVMKLENTSFTREKSEAERKNDKLKDIKDAEDIWQQQSGSANEIALLYVGLARAAGLKVWPMQVVDRSRAVFDRSYLSLRQLDDYIVIVKIDGKDVFLDPGQKMCPFGSLHWKHTFASGLRLEGKRAIFATTPGITYKGETTSRIADLTIDETGSVKGTVRYVMAGPDALYWRQLAARDDEEAVKEQFIASVRQSLPYGVQADFDHFIALDDYDSNLIGFVKVSGNIGSATGKHYFLPGLFFESHVRHPFVAQDKRLTLIDLHYARVEQDDVTYHLPTGYTVEGSPQSCEIKWPSHAELRIDSKTLDDSVEVTRTFARSFILLDSKEYSDLHDYYLKIARADQQQLVLTRVPVAKGN